MAKIVHEFRDPIHVFIRVDTHERKIVDTRPLQRLRYVHQLALSYLVYPGATHRRFEHSLGVMELAGRVFDVVTAPGNLGAEVLKLLPDLANEDARRYWRRAIRVAALCHDIGHLPFSHAAEHELLPEGWDHERLTRELIQSPEMVEIWNSVIPPLRPEHVVKLAVGRKKAKDLEFSPLEELLSEIVVSDAFGVDRVDYLLRDSHHAGVAYGRFDHYRLIDTLRILIPATGEAPTLGVEEGGLLSAEALLLARYYMYSQVYFHPVRVIYDIHLQRFLSEWLPGGQFSTDIEGHLRMTDNEVIAAMFEAARTPGSPGHDSAKRVVERNHFRILWTRNPDDLRKNPDAGRVLSLRAKEQFDAVEHSKKVGGGGTEDFPVLMRDGRVVSSVALSETLEKLPAIASEFVFVAPERQEEASRWIEGKRDEILQEMKEAEE